MNWAGIVFAAVMLLATVVFIVAEDVMEQRMIKRMREKRDARQM